MIEYFDSQQIRCRDVFGSVGTIIKERGSQHFSHLIDTANGWPLIDQVDISCKTSW